MNALLTSLAQLAAGTLVVAVPAVCGALIALRWSARQRTYWRDRAICLELELNELRAPAPARLQPGVHRSLRSVRSVGGAR